MKIYNVLLVLGLMIPALGYAGEESITKYCRSEQRQLTRFESPVFVPDLSEELQNIKQVIERQALIEKYTAIIGYPPESYSVFSMREAIRKELDRFQREEENRLQTKQRITECARGIVVKMQRNRTIQKEVTDRLNGSSPDLAKIVMNYEDDGE